MPISTSTFTTTNLELTPMRVTFNGVDLGGTLGNVAVATTYSKAEIKIDQLGETVIDRTVTGLNVNITTELAEIQKKENWQVVFPHARLVTSGLNKLILFETAVGEKDSAKVHELVLHPLSKGNADLSTDYKFFKAVASAESEIVYSPTEQARLKIVWNVLPDFSVVPQKYYIFGDPSVGVVNASFTAPTYTGTGNGTMTGVAVFNGFTKTETITATLVTVVANAGVFHVNGSLSGSIGLATVGVGFVSEGGEIAFTINDGTTDFVVGDQFTVLTTAANYV